MGLLISKEKTRTMTVNHSNSSRIKLQDGYLIEVDQFSYLGRIVSRDGETDQNVKSRAEKASASFKTLRLTWTSPEIPVKTKLRIFNTNSKSALPCTWRPGVLPSPGVEQDRTHLTVRTKGESGADMATLFENLLPVLSDMPSNGIHYGSEREGDQKTNRKQQKPKQNKNKNTGDEPRKQTGRRWAFHGDRYRCYSMTDRDSEIFLTRFHFRLNYYTR